MLDCWGMGRTLRWHSSPWPALQRSGDTVDAHQNRMIRGGLFFWPGAGMPLVEAIITHDLPECLSGDYSTPDKDSIPGLREALAVVDAIILTHIGAGRLDMNTARRMKWLDVWDAYRWAGLHEPRAMVSGGFPEAVKWLHGEAWGLGIGAEFAGERLAA